MKRIILIAIISLCCIGCSKMNTTGNAYPELYPLIDVPAQKLSSDIDYRYTLSNPYVARTDEYGVTALGRTIAITPKNEDITHARMIDIQKDMDAHYRNKGLLKTRIVESSNSIALDF